jgi:hypothetical protein
LPSARTFLGLNVEDGIHDIKTEYVSRMLKGNALSDPASLFLELMHVVRIVLLIILVMWYQRVIFTSMVMPDEVKMFTS